MRLYTVAKQNLRINIKEDNSGLNYFKGDKVQCRMRFIL